MRRPRLDPPHWHAELDPASIRKLVLEMRNKGQAVRRRDQFPLLPQLKRAIQVELDNAMEGCPDLPVFTVEVKERDFIAKLPFWKKPEREIRNLRFYEIEMLSGVDNCVERAREAGGLKEHQLAALVILPLGLPDEPAHRTTLIRCLRSRGWCLRPVEGRGFCWLAPDIP